MQYAASLSAIGILCVSLIAAVAAQLAAPERILHQPMWPSDVPMILQLQQSKTRPLELKTSLLHQHLHRQCDHEHRSPGKPGADVRLVSPGIRTLPLASPQEVALAIDSHLGQGTLHVQLELSQDLQLLTGATAWEFDLTGERTLTLPLSVQALAEGQHYVHVFIEHRNTDGTSTSRALATEFRVGDGFLRNAYAKSFSVASGSEYRALPASEAIF